ncbi:MAG: GTP cyclohydrolase, FolE2/MptA family, partial [Pseudoxanthomonas sp.]
SSTCPASAALSRQANAERFSEDFAAAHPLSVTVVHDWLESERGLAATPHAQRSRAQVRVELRAQFDELPLVPLIDALEASLGTPVQTAVKRVDEQAFARLNAENLMFCEDAARRVASVLSQDPRIERYQATVSHFESLHPHDAVARVSGANPS